MAVKRDKLKTFNWGRLNQSNTCEILNTTVATLNSWMTKGMPYIEEGNKKFYSPADIFRWKVEYEKKKVLEERSIDGDLSGENSDSLDAYRKAKTAQVQYDLEVKQGKFVPREKYEETLRKAAVFVRKYMQNLGKLLSLKISKEKNPLKIQKIIEEEINNILIKMATVKSGRHS